MNLYLFNAADGSNMYGLGTYLKELIHALKGADFNIHIVHLHSTSPEFEIEKIEDIENWYIPGVYNANTYTKSTQDLEDYCQNVVCLLRLNIKDTKDLIFHFNFNHYQLLAKELKTFFHCKTVITIHYTKWGNELHGNLSRLHALKKIPANQRTSSEQMLFSSDKYDSLLYKEVDRIIALTQYTQNHLYSEYEIDSSKITVIPNGLEDINPLMDTNKAILRRKWHIPENEFLILFVGRLHAAKGVNHLIHAFRKVLEKIPECRLVIAGHGNFQDYMKECEGIWTHVTWTGRVNKEKLYELYAIADIGVMPSLYEPFGYVAVEMMMHGLPIVATSTSGLNEVVDETCGMKIPISELSDKVEIDTELLAEKIAYLLEHPEDAKIMGQNGRKRYLKEYSSKVFSSNMLEFYSSLFL